MNRELGEDFRMERELKMIDIRKMSDTELKDLYKEITKRGEVEREWFKQYCDGDGSYNEFDWKNPYWHIEYKIKDILGDRAVDD